MNRRGFVLLTVMWTMTLIGGLAAMIAVEARLGAMTSANRIALTRAEWARDACLEILLADYAARETPSGLAPVDLGQGTGCRARLEYPEGRIDLNLAHPDRLRALLAADGRVDGLLDWRDEDDNPRPEGAEGRWYREHGRVPSRNGPLADARELLLVRGFSEDVVAALEEDITTSGTGLVDVNHASERVLNTFPALQGEATDVILFRRTAGRQVTDLEDLMSLLAPSSRARIEGDFQDLKRMLIFGPTVLMARTEGWVAGSRVRATGSARLIPVGHRLAIARREVS